MFFGKGLKINIQNKNGHRQFNKDNFFNYYYCNCSKNNNLK